MEKDFLERCRTCTFPDGVPLKYFKYFPKGFQIACVNGHLLLAQQLYDDIKEDINIQDYIDNAFIEATKTNHTETIGLLVTLKVSLRAIEIGFMNAVRYNDASMVELLYYGGGGVNVLQFGIEPIEIGIEKKDIRLLKWLKPHYPSDVLNKHASKWFKQAIMSGQIEMAKLFGTWGQIHDVFELMAHCASEGLVDELKLVADLAKVRIDEKTVMSALQYVKKKVIYMIYTNYVVDEKISAKAMAHAIIYDNPEIAKFIYKFGKVDMELLKESLRKNLTHVSRETDWLVEIGAL
jgi:hypothetical protein